MRRSPGGGWLAPAGALALAALVYSFGRGAAANYDEGVYLASLDALRHGQELGTDVYASQPPGFYLLLEALSYVTGDGVDALRWAFVVVALTGLVAAYAIGRRLAGGWGGLGAAVLLAVTAPYPAQTARVQADTASVVLSLGAVAVACYAGRRSWRWAAVGALVGAATAVKLLALPVVAPLAVLIVARRAWRAAGAALAGAAVVWAAALLTHATALEELWRSVVSDHWNARELGPSHWDNAERVLLHPLDWRTPAGILVPVGLVCAVVLLRRLELLALGAWIVTSAVFLVAQQPLLDHHFVLLAATLAVPAGAGLGAAVVHAPRHRVAVVVGVLGVALVVGFAQEGRRLDRQDGDPPGVAWAAEQLRAHTQPDELVGTDLPIVAHLADRRVPGQLIDSSFVRLGTGSLTDAEILEELRRNGVRAVAVGRLYAERPELLAAMRARYPRQIERNDVTLYLAP